MDTVGTRLKKARMDAMFSRPEVEIELGLPPGYIGKLECEEVLPVVGLVKRLAELYQVDMNWLCMIGEKMNDYD